MNSTIIKDYQQQQGEYAQRWLQFAPSPPNRETNSYDAFISYRSSDRAWAMALYDILRLAHWEPFLDQYDLVPGSNLETSLSESLQASSSGVILWSSRTKDSEWCKRERNAMTTLRGQRPSFKYVFAKLDRESLPLFAQADLYIDCEDSPEGPRGVNLLKLMCGMRGIPLPPEAVTLAQVVDQDAQQMLIRIRGAIEAGNSATLRELGTSVEPSILASPTVLQAAAEGLISMGAYEDALGVAQHGRAFFPKSLRLRQLEGLALRRMRRFQDAIDVLSQLKADGHQDPETTGILAAAWDGLYQESGKTLHLRRSRELYRTAFQVDPKDFYTGINAASKSAFLGDMDEARRLADAVLPLVKSADDGRDFWAGCTLGEVYLLRGELSAATGQYQRVIDKHAGRTGDLSGTRDQARRICSALSLSVSESQQLLAPFDLL